VISCGAKPFITDTNTLYKGRRSNTCDHLEQARSHGFSIESLGAPVVIADGLIGSAHREIVLNLKNSRSVFIASDIVHSDAMLVVTHITGHGLAGLGGTLKNVGMGCASRAGKLAQHAGMEFRVVESECRGCGTCAKWCPAEAIEIPEAPGSRKKALINYDICIGCGECFAVCPAEAIAFDWAASSEVLQEKLCEYVKGALRGKEGKAAFFSYLVNITRDCDCTGRTQRKIVPDIGILASFDPVALDTASSDLIKSRYGKDLFREIYPRLDYTRQLAYGEKIGLGSTKYEIVEV